MRRLTAAAAVFALLLAPFVGPQGARAQGLVEYALILVLVVAGQGEKVHFLASDMSAAANGAGEIGRPRGFGFIEMDVYSVNDPDCRTRIREELDFDDGNRAVLTAEFTSDYNLDVSGFLHELDDCFEETTSHIVIEVWHRISADDPVSSVAPAPPESPLVMSAIVADAVTGETNYMIMREADIIGVVDQ